jgi:hypothetical protein
LVFSNADVVDELLRSLGFDLWRSHRFSAHEQRLMLNGAALDVFLRRPVLVGASLAFRANYRDLILPLPSGRHWGHDLWIGDLISSVADVAFINERLMAYRQHGSNLFGANSNISLKHRISLPVKDRARTESHLLSARKHQQLLERLDAPAGRWPYRSDSRSRIQGKTAHEIARASMPNLLFRRLPLV